MEKSHPTYLMMQKDRRKDTIKGGLLLGMIIILIGTMLFLGSRTEFHEFAGLDISCKAGFTGDLDCTLG